MANMADASPSTWKFIKDQRVNWETNETNNDEGESPDWCICEQ